jgi:CRISPR-associated endonuclease/helicase Cas3
MPANSTRGSRPQIASGLWHLSGLMCAQHRSDTIADIKQAFGGKAAGMVAGQNPAPIRVISTQLVEAGVDIDFPVVYRALAGLDSIAQAAGRCNREGRLARAKCMSSCRPSQRRRAVAHGRTGDARLWEALPPEADPMGVERFRGLFPPALRRRRSWTQKIVNLLRAGRGGDVNFRTAAERFRLIDEAEGATVFVRYKRNAGRRQSTCC